MMSTFLLDRITILIQYGVSGLLGVFLVWLLLTIVGKMDTLHRQLRLPQKLFVVMALSSLCLFSIFVFPLQSVHAASSIPSALQSHGALIPPPSNPATHDNRQNGFILGKTTENSRKVRLTFTNHNAGMGMWYITNGTGLVVLQGTIEDGSGGTFFESGSDGHVEMQMLDAFRNALPNQLDYTILPALIDAGPQSVLHVVIFTQLIPCNPCQGSFDPFLNDMALRIQAAALNTPTIPTPGPGCSCPSNNPNDYGVSLSVYNTTDQSQYGQINNRTMNANNNNMIGNNVTGVSNAFYGQRGYKDPQETY